VIHINTQKINHIISKEKDVFTRSGTRLTEKHKHALECLLESNTPLPVYEIAGAINRVSENTMTIMSVYQVIEVFEIENLVHKLNSANKYVACSHKSGDCTQEITQFLSTVNANLKKNPQSAKASSINWINSWVG
jgi:Fur family zinc uptake transcriptional regulator